MKIGVIISTGVVETAWNAYRFASHSLNQGDEVKIFLISEGVESQFVNDEDFDVVSEIKRFLELKGEMFVCGTCLKKRKIDLPRFGQRANLAHLHEIVTKSDRVVTF